MEATFKPTLFGKAQSYRLQGGILSQIEDNSTKWELALAQVDHVAYVDTVFKKNRGTRLDLHHGDIRGNTCRSLRLGQPAMDWINNPETRAFLTLAREVCTALERAQPGIEITQGEYGRARFVMFVIGILTVLFAVGIVALAVLTGVPNEKLFAGLVPIGLMLFIGAYVSYSSRPWQVLAKMPAAGFARRFDRWLNPNDPPLD